MTLSTDLREQLNLVRNAGNFVTRDRDYDKLVDLLTRHASEIADALEARDQDREAGRLAGIEEAAQIAEGHVISGNDKWCEGADHSARKIARAIREKAR